MVLELFPGETEAAIAKGFLEANGINVYIFNSDPAGRVSIQVGTNLDFATRLMVASSDFNDARELLKKKAS